ncbi:MAG: hypothetical protein ACI37T_07545 [Candidatus Gastranaerophilaceae bacterium]
MKNLVFLSIFDDLTKNQKSSFFAYIKIFTKKYAKYSVDDIWNKFSEEQNYLEENNHQVFTWLNNFWDKPNFEKSVKFIINTEKQKISIREKNKIYYNQHKEKINAWKNKARQWKQSKEKPTKKQIAYYIALCKKIGKQTGDLSCLSKLDLVNMIAELATNKKTQNDGL